MPLPTVALGGAQVALVLLGTLAAVVLVRLARWRANRAELEKQGLVYTAQHSKWLADVPVMRANFERIFDFRMERRLDTGQLTVGVPTPFWMSGPIISTVDPVVVKHILKDDFPNFSKGPSAKDVLGQLLGDGIFVVSHGPHAPDDDLSWTAQRKTSSRIFTRNTFRTHMYSVFSNHARILAHVMTHRLAGGSDTVDMQQLMFKYTLDSIGQIGFGVELNALTEGSPFEKPFDEAQRLIARRSHMRPGIFGVLAWVLFKEERELCEHIEALDRFTYKLIKLRRQQLASGNSSGHEDILSLFLLDEEAAYGDKMLRDVVLSFLIAGRDTTACTLSFALLLLASHPEAQERARAEVKSVLENRPDRILTLEDIKSSVPFLTGVINESLRLFPPVPSDSKVAMCDATLPNGMQVPKGTRVIFEIYQMGREQSIWGPDAAKFDPDRWQHAKSSSFDFPVFQAGPRVCLGQAMAMFESQLLLGFLVDRFRFSLPTPDAHFTYQPGITISVRGGLPLKVESLS